MKFQIKKRFTEIITNYFTGMSIINEAFKKQIENLDRTCEICGRARAVKVVELNQINDLVDACEDCHRLYSEKEITDIVKEAHDNHIENEKMKDEIREN